MVHQNNTIGGYFALELNSGEDYWPEAIRLNTARNVVRSELYLPSGVGGGSFRRMWHAFL